LDFEIKNLKHILPQIDAKLNVKNNFEIIRGYIQKKNHLLTKLIQQILTLRDKLFFSTNNSLLRVEKK